MSVIFDCFWWWRAEFGGQCFPYDEKDDQELPAANSTGPKPSPLPTSNASGEESHELETYQLPDLDLQFPENDFGTFPDWEWAAAFKLPSDIDMNLPDLPDLELGG